LRYPRRPQMDDGSRTTRLPEPPRMFPASSAPADLPLDRGIYYDLFHGYRVFFAVCSDGQRLPGIRVPIGQETECEAVLSLADALDVADPPPSSRAWLRLVRDESSPRPAC
jgi:hypothetical protein